MAIQNKLVYLFFSLLSVVGLRSYSQDVLKQYVSQHLVKIRTIEPDSNNYADLAPIGKAIGERTVVMLGEQSHGDAATFLAKSRLIKFLHERKGFDVLAFESDFWGLNDGWDHLDKNRPQIKDFIQSNVSGIWTLCSSCSNLFYKYIPDSYLTKKPLIITGFDDQFNMSYSSENFKARLDSFLESQKQPKEQIAMVNTVYQKIMEWNSLTPKNPDEVIKSSDDLEAIKSQLIKNGCMDQFWLLIFDNLISGLDETRLQSEGKYSGNLRDIQMAKNLDWLANVKFKGRKIIVWAANRHIAKSVKNVNDSLIRTEECMGDHFISMGNGEKCYTLGFTSFQGSGGRIGGAPYKIDTPPDNSLENWIYEKNYDFAFINFDAFNINNKNFSDDFSMAPLGHFSAPGNWNKIFDGIFYIKNMYPCTPLTVRP